MHLNIRLLLYFFQFCSSLTCFWPMNLSYFRDQTKYVSIECSFSIRTNRNCEPNKLRNTTEDSDQQNSILWTTQVNTMALASGIIFVAIVLYTIFKKVVSFNYWHTKNVPYLEPSFPFGNLKGAGKKFHASQVILNAYNKFKSTDAKYCGIYSWKQPVAIILDLDLINRILVRDSVNFQDKDDLLSSNLFVVNGERRGKLREKFQSTFSSSKWKQIFPTVLRIGDRLHDALINTVEKDEEILEIDDLMMRYTCDQMGTFMFGECNSLRDTNVDFLQICKKIRTNNRHGPSSNAFKAPYRGFARIFRMKECSDDITNFFLGITKETIEHREQNKIHKNDLMDVLLKLKNESENENDKMTNNEIAAQLFIFLANGLEDTAILLTCCLFELAHNVDVQNKARREIQKALKKHDGKFTYEMIMNTPYVEQVIRGQ